MSLSGADLRITDQDDTSVGYVLDQTQPAVLHTATSPNVPLNAAMSTPTQPGGQYDVRDTEGDKAITHLDWVQGQGQKTLDSETSVYSRYLDSSYVDVSVKGRLKLLHPAATNEVMNTSGPIFSAAGKLWLGRSLGALMYSSDGGANWSDATIGGTPVYAPIKSLCTDGTKVYFCHPTGADTGIWVNTAATPGTFAKFGGTPTTAAIEAIAYNGGLLYAAEIGGAGLVNTTTGVYTQATPAFLNTSMVTVGLVSAGNSVFWVLSQNGRSYVYKLYYDPATSVMLCEQYGEFPAGFIATCAVGYLGNVDVGGYFESSTPGVGKGIVYRVAGGMSALLFEIGDLPEDTDIPGDPENDNRIVAACNGSKNEYFLTTRSLYRWDMDDGGYSHVFDYPGIGTLSGGERRVPALATGGTITTSSGFTTHAFTSSGTLVVPSGASFSGICSLTGGGGGGSSGGGGAGGAFNNVETLAGSMSVTVGNGGAGRGEGAANGDNGQDSVFGTHTAAGGGGGGRRESHGSAGASGGGGGASGFTTTLGGAATPSGQGHAGGGNAGRIADPCPAGGGGGVGDVGGNALSATQPGCGGEGFTGAFSLVKRGGGGGGGAYLNGGIGVGRDGGGDGLNWTSNGAAGTPGTGGGGGGAGQNHVGGNGGSGSALITYRTADAARTIGSMSGLIRPSVAYEKGNLYAPYAESAGVRTLTITGNTQDNPTVITTSEAHGIPDDDAQIIFISGSNSNVLIDGLWLATYVSPTTFSIPVAVATTAGTAGTVVCNYEVGWAATDVGYKEQGWLRQSPTTFHTGSMMKDFRCVSVSHDPLPEGSYLLSRWKVDGVSTEPTTGTLVEIEGIGWFVTGVPNGTKETRFAIDSEGYSIDTSLLMACDTTGLLTPVVKGINVIWNFVKNKKHTYSLDCRSGANAGRWNEDPLAAVQFLYATANKRATFEDRYAGVYQGAIESVEFTPAPISPSEGPSGICKVTVREEA